jgi:predicted dehydrogenase
MSDQPVRVGVIGAGVGQAHLAAYAALPEVECVGLADLNEERARAVAATYGVPEIYQDYRNLLARTDLDAVSVCLPNALHAPVTIAALQHGKHVLVEKPMARTVAEAAAMIAAAEAAERILMVSFNYRYRADVQWLKQHIERGALGRLYYAKAHWMRRSGIPRLGSWFVSKEQAGGGPLIDLGVHVLDLALYLMGEPNPQAVSANTYAEFGPRGLKGGGGTWDRAQPGETLPYEVEDLATAFIRLDGGATLLLEASWATHGAAGDDFGVTLFGTEGGAELLIRSYTHENTVRVFTDIAGVPTDLTPYIPKVEGHPAVIRRFIAAIREGAPAVPSAAEGLRRTAVLAACYQSAAEGQEIRL